MRCMNCNLVNIRNNPTPRYPPSVMSTQFVTTTIPVPTSVNQMQANVIAALSAQGEPLRWSITKVASGLLYIEAIVTWK
jgi:hypothetical protein